jgi:phospholipase/carboxylesterase
VSRLAPPIGFAAPLAFALSLTLTACHGDRSLPGRAAATASTASPADTEAAGIRFLERLTGGADAAEPLPLVVGIHGFGGRPERFGRALAALQVKARVILPYGTEVHGGGFAWFDGWNDDAQVADGSRRAADRLLAMIAELSRRHPTVGKPIVTGFSQGGILSYTIAVLHPDAVRAAFPAGGFLPPPLLPTAWPAGQPTPLLHAFHGAADERVPIDADRATVRGLDAVGLHVELTEYPGVEHVLAGDMERDLVRAIEAALRAPGP